MNKIYKVIWSKVKHQYVVTSEFAHSCTKSTTSRAGRSAAAVLAALILTTGICAVPAQAADPTLEELYYEQLNSTVHNDETSSPVVKLVEAPTVVPTAAKDGEQAVDNDTQTGEDGGMTGAADQYTVVNEDGFYASNTKGTHNTLSKDGLWVGGTDDNTGFYVDNDGNMRTTENAEIDGNLTVKGDTNLKNTTVDGDFKAKNDAASVVLNEDGLILRSSGAQGNGTISMNDGTLSLRNGNAENTTFVDVTTNGTTFSQLTDNSKTTISGGNIVTDSVTGLDNTEWKGTTNDASRAATEGQLADLSTTVSENAEGVVKWDQDANGDYQEGTIHGVTLQDGAITAANGNFSVDELGNVTATVADTNNSFSLTENGVSMKADNTTLDVTSGGVAIGNGAGSTYINGSEINTGTVLAGEMYVGTKDDGNAVVTKDQLTGTVGEATEGVVKWDKDENGDYQEGKLTVDSLTAAGGTFTISEEGIVNAGDKIVLNGTTGQVLADRIGTNDVTTQSFTAGNGKIKIDKDGKLTTTGDVLMQNGDGESISMTDGGLNLMTVDADNGTGMVTVANGAVRMIGGGNTTVKVDGSGTTFGTQTGMDTTTISGGSVTTNSVTGLTNRTWTGSTTDASRAATEGQLADLSTTVSENAEGVVKWDQDANGDYQEGTIHGVTLQDGAITAANGNFSVDELGNVTATVADTNNSFSLTENGVSMKADNTTLDVTSGGVAIGNGAGSTYINGSEINTGTVLAGEMYVGTKDDGNAVVTKDQLTGTVGEATEGVVKWDKDENGDYQEGKLTVDSLTAAGGTFTISEEGIVNAGDKIVLNGTTGQVLADRIGTNDVTTQSFTAGNGKIKIDKDGKLTTTGDVLMQNGDGESISMTDGGLNLMTVDADNGTGMVTVANGAVRMIGGGNTTVKVDGSGTTFGTQTGMDTTTISGGRITTGTINAANGNFVVHSDGSVESQSKIGAINGEFSNLLHATVGRFDTLQVGTRTGDNFAFYVAANGSVDAANGAFRVDSKGGVHTSYVTGLTNTTWNPDTVQYEDSTNAATEAQLAVVDSKAQGNTDVLAGYEAAGITAGSIDETVTDNSSIAIGNGATISQISGLHEPIDSIAIGHNAGAHNGNTISIGADSNVSGENSVAIGKGAQATAYNSVALGANSLANREDSVSVGNNQFGWQRQITNVADGTYAHDAATVGQIADVLGLEDPNGKGLQIASGPEGYTFKNGAKSVVAGINKNSEAIESLSKEQGDIWSSLDISNQNLETMMSKASTFAAMTSNVDWNALNSMMSLDVTPTMLNEASTETTSADTAQKRDPVWDNIKVTEDTTTVKNNLTVEGDTQLNGKLDVKGEATFNNDVNIKGDLNMNNNKITGVANGDISETSKDAVNGSQLYGVQQDVEANAKNISTLGGAVNKLGNRIDEVGAGAAALAALHPLDFDPDNKWDFSAGYGNYRGESAVAFGAFYRPNEDTMFSVGGTVGNDDNMVNAGVSIKIGSGSSGVTTSRVAMAKEIKAMRDVVAKQDAQIQKLTAMVNALVGVEAEPDTTTMFPDVPENHWAYEAVATMARSGLVKGYPDGEFKGDRTMTRYEFAQIIQNAIQAGAEVDSRLVEEFKPELEYFHIATVAKDKDGNPTIERVRAN